MLLVYGQLYRQLKRSLGSCSWLCQVVLALGLCRHHQMGGQSATAQGTPYTLWRNPRVPWDSGWEWLLYRHCLLQYTLESRSLLKNFKGLHYHIYWIHKQAATVNVLMVWLAVPSTDYETLFMHQIRKDHRSFLFIIVCKPLWLSIVTVSMVLCQKWLHPGRLKIG